MMRPKPNPTPQPWGPHDVLAPRLQPAWRRPVQACLSVAFLLVAGAAVAAAPLSPWVPTLTVAKTNPTSPWVGQTLNVKTALQLPNGSPVPTGQIRIVDGATNCTATLPALSCSLPITAAGVHTITATYSGDSDFLPTNVTVNVTALADPNDTDGDGIPNGVESGEGLNANLKDNALLANTSQGQRLFVMQQFRDLLYREGSSNAISYWSTQMANGMSRSQLVQNFLNSAPANNQIKPLARLFIAYFGNVYFDGSINGFVSYAQAVASGSMDVATVASKLVVAPKVIELYGNQSDTDFANMVLKNVLGRSASNQELSAALSSIGSMGRAAWLKQQADTPAFVDASANQVFVEVVMLGMGRKVTPAAGEQYWLNKLAANASAGKTELVEAYLGNLLPNYAGAVAGYNARFYPAAPATTQNLGLIGGNIDGVADWSRTHPFVDLMKQARKFSTAASPWDGAGTVGADGWPVGDFGVTLMTEQQDVTGISGIYKMAFTGQATVAVVAGQAQIKNKVYNAGTNTTTADIDFPVGENSLFLSFTNTGAGVKNLRVLHPGYALDNTPIYRTEFLNHLKRVQMLRFMDWTRTNGSPVVTWANRAAPATAHDGSQGVTWEDVIALGNATGKAIWINVPHKADNNYVQNLAQLVNSSLNPGIPVYIEYSNEIWNFGFDQFGDNLAVANAEVNTNPNSPLNYDAIGNQYYWNWRYTSKRLMEISNIFRSVVGDSKMMTVYRPVLAGQVVLPDVMKTGLDMINAKFGPPNQYFYALAGAPYFSMGDKQTTEGLTPTQVLDALEQAAKDSPRAAMYETNGALAAWYGLKFMGYESGVDTFGPGSLASKDAANRDPRMQTICQNYLDDWFKAGFDTINWYVVGAGPWDGQYGSWPITYDLNFDSPKTACLDSANAKTPPAPALRHTVPGTWDARESPDVFAPFNEPYVRWVHQPSYRDIMFYVNTPGQYSLSIKGSALSSTNGSNEIKIQLNNSVLIPKLALSLSANNAMIAHGPYPLTLKKGINVLRFSSANADDAWILGEVSVQ